MDCGLWTVDCDGLRRVQTVFEQMRDVALNFFELVEMKVRVGDREHFASLGLLVNNGPLALTYHLLLYFEHAFAFQHDCEYESGGNIPRVIQLDQLLENRLGSFLLDRLSHRWWRLINALPLGDETIQLLRTGESFLPAAVANVLPAQFHFFLEQYRVVRLLVGERLLARFAGVGAALNVPIVHFNSI